MFKIIFLSLMLVMSLAQNKSQTGDLIANISESNVTLKNGHFYAINISIGTPPQYFDVLVDTTANLLAGFYYRCPYCSNQNGFNPNLSPNSFNVTGNQTTMNNSNGSAVGIMAYAEVGLARTPIDENMLMAFITSEQGYSVGSMGLSNNIDYLNIFEIAFLHHNKTVKSPHFALALQPLPYPSYMIYNMSDKMNTSSVKWVQSINKQQWQVKLNSLSFGNKTQPQLQQNSSAIFDSSYTNIELENTLYLQYIQTYASHICNISKDYSSYQCPCRPNQQQESFLPSIVYGLDNINVTIPYQNFLLDYNIKPIGICDLMMKPTNGSSTIRFGIPVLQSMIASFDKIRNMVGIQVKK